MRRLEKSGLSLLMFFIVSLLLVSCGDKNTAETTDGGSTPGTSETTTSTSAETTPPTSSDDVESPEEPEHIKIDLGNSTGFVFYEIYISPTSESLWGEDLFYTEILADGDRIELTIFNDDLHSYDIKVVDEDEDEYIFERVLLLDGTKLDIVWDDDLAAETTYPNGDSDYVLGELIFSDPGVDENWREMVFYNNSGWVFEDIRILESGSDDLGYNHIGYQYLQDQDQCDIGVEGCDEYDVVLFDTEGDAWIFEEVTLAEGADVYIGVADDGTPVMEIMAENEMGVFWGEFG